MIEPELKLPEGYFKRISREPSSTFNVEKNDPSVCERFEVYLSGVEIGNALMS